MSRYTWQCSSLNSLSVIAPSLSEEAPHAAGLGGLLTAARRIGSREQLARSLQDASCFFLVPEGLSRELRGRGLAAWAHENVLQPLAELQAPPGTVRVGGRDGSGATFRAVERETFECCAVAEPHVHAAEGGCGALLV